MAPHQMLIDTVYMKYVAPELMRDVASLEVKRSAREFSI